MKKIYIPSNLNLTDLIDQDYQNDKDIDRLHYIINLIYEQKILYKISNEYVPLKAIYLRSLIIRNYNEYIKVLTEKGIIECDNYFIKSEKSLGYKLCDQYSKVRHKAIEFKTQWVQKNIDKWKKNRLPTTDIHLYLYSLLKKIEIKYEEALEYVDSLDVDEYNSSKIAIDKFKNKDFFLYTDDFGKRVHTNITNLKSILRKYLFYNNEKLVNIDISNSQPLLLIPSIFSIRCTFDINTERDLVYYKHLVEHGELYSYLMEQAGETDRAVFKEKFFRETFFGKKTSKLFCRLFPTIAMELLKIKSKNYRNLARMMQRTESKLMITKICGRIMREYPNVFISTIHDSILTTEDNISKIQKIISEEFGKYDLSPTIRIETT